MIIVLKACQRELKAFPKSIREDLADALARLEEGHKLGMPLSRPMPDIGKGVHELRLKDPGGIYRIIYALIIQGNVYVLHAFKKKSPKGKKTPKPEMEIINKRFREAQTLAKEGQ